MNFKKLAAAVAIAAGSMGAAHATNVALELALVIDVSGSVDSTEYGLQRDGYKAAFQSAGIKSAIESFSASGGIAVGVYYFANNVIQAVNWTQLLTAADSQAFGTFIGNIANPVDSTAAIGGGTLGAQTNIAESIDRAVEGLGSNTFVGARQVIDVSGDGRQNTARAGDALAGCQFGGPGTEAVCISQVTAARNAAELAGVVINGLAITNDVADLATYYDTNVATSTGFVYNATFATFANAVAQKIGREVTGNVPEPASLALVGLALAGLGFASRRKA